MIIEIEPLDTVIFRDGKPFGMGDDSWTNTLLLPTPTTIYGALRGTYFSQNPQDLKNIKVDDVTESLIIKGIYLYGNDGLLYKVPKDCVYRLENQEEIKVLKLKENNLTNSPLDYNLSLEEEIKSIGDVLLDDITFEEYLNGKDSLYGIDLEKLITVENKIGIGRDTTTRTTKEGLLYRVQMLQYRFKIVVEFEGLKLNSIGLMKFGGEAKGANYKELNSFNLPYAPTINNSYFKLYLLTPTIFDKGWLPSWIDKKSLIGEYKGVKLKLISCAIGKPQSIGGFDMKINQPKEMLKAIPSGGVYYFELLEGEKERLGEIFHLNSISDKRANEGYGVIVLSEVKK